MFYLVLSCHLLLCLAMIGLVLLQQGKGADLGAALGGSSQSVFGAAGASGLLIKVTTSIAVLFMVTSILLVRIYQKTDPMTGAVVDPLAGSVMEGMPVAPVEVPANKINVEGSSPSVAVDPVAVDSVAGEPAVVDGNSSGAAASSAGADAAGAARQ